MMTTTATYSRVRRPIPTPNRARNHNLEEQAQALYKSWFVDFEPFKDGKFVDSELGMIPEGWQIMMLSDFALLKKDSVNPAKNPNTLYAHYSIPAFDDNQKPEMQYGSDILSNKFLVPNQCVLFSKLNPRIKRVWTICNSMSNAICSTEFAIYQAIQSSDFGFLCSYINSDTYYDKAISLVNGATGSHQRFHTDDTLEFEIPAKKDIVSRFSNIVMPLYQQIAQHREENQKLVEKRDVLLPRLMTGELSINEICC